MPGVRRNSRTRQPYQCSLLLLLLLVLLAPRARSQCSVSLLSTTDIDCYGAATGSASVVASGASPFQYAWSSGGSGPFKNGLTAGTHSVTMTDNNNCMDTLTFVLTQPDSFGINPILDLPTCHGDNDGSIYLDVFGGTSLQGNGPDSLDVGPYTGTYSAGFTRGFHFKAPVSFRIRSLHVPTDIGSDPQSIQVVRFAAPPNQSLTAFTTLYYIALSPGTNAIPVDIPIAAGDEIGILGGRDGAVGNLKCSYGPMGHSTTIAGYPVQAERIYFQGNIASFAAPTGSIDRQAGGILARIGMTYSIGNYSYQWNPTATTQSLSGLSSGSYAVTVTDSLNCVLTQNILLGQPDALQVDSAFLQNIACVDDTAGGAIQLQVLGGLPRQDTIAYRVDTTGTFAPVSGAFTSLILTDDELRLALPIGFTFRFYGQDYSNFAISSNGFISFGGNAHGCCSGQQLPLSNFPNNLIAFAWEDLSPQLGGTIGYLQSGTAPNRKLVVEFDSVPHFGSTSLLVSAQVILYETSNIIEIHTTRMDTDGGPHTMGIENATGTRAAVRPGRNGNGFWSATNDYVAFVPQGGYAYNWSNGGMGPGISNVNAGNYAVTITDSVGCTLVQNYTIGTDAVLQASMALTDISCYGAADGMASASITGAYPPIQYFWSNGDSVANLSGLPAQNIYFTIEDSLGCRAASDTLVIREPDSLQLLISSADARCEFDQDGQAVVAVTGGVGTYHYAWNDPGQQMSDTAFALAAGNYQVIVTDSNNCADTAQVSIGFQLTAPVATFPDLDSLCLGLPDFALTTGMPGGGVYSGPGVSNGQFSTTAAGPGVHDLVYTVTDANGCQGTDTSYVNIKICAGLENVVGQDWKAFPVPTEDVLKWEGSVVAGGEWLEFYVSDLIGKVQLRTEQFVAGAGRQTLRFDLSGLAAGTYLFEVRSETNRWVQRVVKD